MKKMRCAKSSARKQIEKLELSSYQKVNNSFHKRMVFRTGVDSGFFVEMNCMVNGMLYCLVHKIKFQIYSEDANFGTGIGWTEYFQPFCDEVHDKFHRRFNFHKLPSWHRILKMCKERKSFNPLAWKIKSVLKTAMGRLCVLWVYKRHVLLSQDVSIHPDIQYVIPELGIDCSYTKAFGLLAKMVWRFQPEIMSQESLYKAELKLPSLYDGIHLRGGDKITEADLISATSIMHFINEKSHSCFFTLTDDYRMFERIRRNCPAIQFLTLCQPDERGYHHQQFMKTSLKSKKEAIIRLIISVDLLLKARSFLGSITTGPSVFIMKIRIDDPLVMAVDCPKALLELSLSKTIGERAVISKRVCAEKKLR